MSSQCLTTEVKRAMCKQESEEKDVVAQVILGVNPEELAQEEMGSTESHPRGQGLCEATYVRHL